MLTPELPGFLKKRSLLRYSQAPSEPSQVGVPWGDCLRALCYQTHAYIFHFLGTSEGKRRMPVDFFGWRWRLSFFGGAGAKGEAGSLKHWLNQRMGQRDSRACGPTKKWTVGRGLCPYL